MPPEEHQQLIAEVIETLPTRLRKPFVMRHVLGTPREEIAAELHISVRQVDRRLTRAVVACRRRLSP